MDENTTAIVASNLTLAAFNAAGDDLIRSHSQYRPGVRDADSISQIVLHTYRLLLIQLGDSSSG